MRFLALIFLLHDIDLTANAAPVLALLLEDTVGRISLDVLVLAFVDALVPLDVGWALVASLVAASLFCAPVVRAGASAGTDLTADLLLLRCFIFFA